MEKNKNIAITFCLILIIFLSGIQIDFLSAAAKKKISAKKAIPSKVSKSKSKKSKKSISKSKSQSKKKKKKKRRRRFIRPIRMKYPQNFEIVKDTMLCDGVNYKKILYGTKYKHLIHIVEADIYNDNIMAQVIKGDNIITGLEKLQSMTKRYELTSGDTVVSAVNGNFWKAGTNYPIGPTIVDGELIEMITHKKWSAALFNSESEMFIDNYNISGDMMSKGKYLGSISRVNRRSDSVGIVVYNKFAGDAIPFISSINLAADIQSAFKQLQSEQEYRDSSDIEVDSLQLVQDLISQKQLSNMEFHLIKSVCRYITDPAVNKPIKCIVETVGQGVALMPKYGCVISYGSSFSQSNMPKVGDTIIIKYSTDVHPEIKFYQGVSGTPRLVRNGKASQEAYFEGSRGNRFINMQLPRTAIGTDKSRERLFLVTVEGTISSDYKAGANLEQMAQIMSKIGAWNAMNLDGGGSTIMVIDKKNILFPGKPEIGRRLSVGIGIIKINNNEQISQ